MTNKRLKGQFFTTNSDYILKGFSKYIKGKDAMDPFAGNKDLISWATKNGVKKIKGFDVDPAYIDNKVVFKNDSINCPKRYNFVLTNPPYLHKNKATKDVKEKYFRGLNSRFEDLYQASINAILDSNEGILILPLNFLSAENSKKIRNLFFSKFQIISLNIFKEQVFEDTTYNVISFYYKKNPLSDKNTINAMIFPDNKKIKLTLNKKYGWRLGGEFSSTIDSVENFLGIYRLREKHLLNGKEKIKLAHNNIKNINTYEINKATAQKIRQNIIFLRAIDSKNGRKIQLEDIRKYKAQGLIGKNTSRNMAYLLFETNVDISTQKKLISHFNEELTQNRKKYLSLFLTNFRDNNRKRIGFDFAYKLINHIYANKLSTNPKIC
jgi:hypothetical protein